MDTPHFDEKAVRARMQGPAIWLLVMALFYVLWFGMSTLYGCLGIVQYAVMLSAMPGLTGDDLALFGGLGALTGCSTFGSAALVLASVGVAYAASRVLGEPTRRTVLLASLGIVLLPVIGTLATMTTCSVCACIGGPLMTVLAIVPALWLFSLSQDPETAQWLTRHEPEPDLRG